MGYILSQAETILLAKNLLSIGKSTNLVHDTLIRRGGDPEHVALIIQEITEEKNNKAQKDKVIGLSFVCLGILWILLVYSFELNTIFQYFLPKFFEMLLIFGPLCLGLLILIKGQLKISRLKIAK